LYKYYIQYGKEAKKMISKDDIEKLFRLRSSYNSMISRCYSGNKNSRNYKNYEERGISVCDEWKNSFYSFYCWSIQNGYEIDLTIDRIDNNGNYEPNNCRWTTRKVQANNRRDNKKTIRLLFQGEKRTLKEIAALTGQKYVTLATRKQRGFVGEEIIYGKTKNKFKL
jgi:hypothetical protein